MDMNDRRWAVYIGQTVENLFTCYTVYAKIIKIG